MQGRKFVIQFKAKRFFLVISSLNFLSCLLFVGCKNKANEGNVVRTNAEGMIWIEGGEYSRGNDKDPGNLEVFLKGVQSAQKRAEIIKKHFYDEHPVHRCKVKGFYIDKTEVTNRQFAAFVKDTGYVTFAEKGVSKNDFPNANQKDLKPGATVFKIPKKKLSPYDKSVWNWWSFEEGVSWRNPEGKGSSIENKMDHPVVCVNYDDAKSYAQWAGKRLPTEAEWERAARGGVEKRMFLWGNEIQKKGEWMTNCFQGDFPNNPKKEDGYFLTAPVGSFPVNGFGLHDMAGNVWEICSDYYNPFEYRQYEGKVAENPQGTSAPLDEGSLQQLLRGQKIDRKMIESLPSLVHLRSMRGGSFLCHSSYCLRFRPAARHYHEPLTPSHHVGFRCVKDQVN